MTNAEHLIRQAIRELHIDIAPYHRAVEISKAMDGEAFAVSFKNRSGDPVDVEISAEAGYAAIYEVIRKGWYQ